MLLCVWTACHHYTERQMGEVIDCRKKAREGDEEEESERAREKERTREEEKKGGGKREKC